MAGYRRSPYEDIDSCSLHGNVSFRLQGENTVSWCKTNAPSKYEAITNKCGSFNAKWEHTNTYTIVHQKLIY